MATGIERMTSLLGAITGTDTTPAQVQRVVTHLYVLTKDPSTAATDEEKAIAVLALARNYFRFGVNNGAQAIASQTQAQISLAAISSYAASAVEDI